MGDEHIHRKPEPAHQPVSTPFFRRSPATVTPGPAPFIQRQEGSSPWRFRVPALEVLGTQFGDAFSSDSTPLTSAQISTARTIFGNSINYSAVRIVTATIINAPTTLANNIRIAPGYTLSNATLIHELAHIWQYQTKGNAYISDSAFHQVAATVATGDRNAAYEYEIVSGQSIHHYTAEQQAMIIEHYYTNQNNERSNPEYIRMLDEVRSSTPSLTDLERYEESLYGPRTRNQDIMDSMPNPWDVPGLPPMQLPGNVLRIEF